MSNIRFSELLKGQPGDYVIDVAAYGSQAEFERDLDIARRLCERRRWHFSSIDDPRTRKCQAFFVHINDKV